MALSVDPTIAAALAELAELAAAAGYDPPARGDALALRAAADASLTAMYSRADPAPDVSSVSYAAVAEDGAEIALRWYTRKRSTPGSAVLFVHGGGMVCGSVEHYDPVVRQYVQWTGVPFLAVEYRLAPEAAGETLAGDCLAALRWLRDHASGLGVERDRIAVMGDSGGGGVAAGMAILARDAGIQLARQILIYPMLDDRSVDPDPFIEPYATWTYDSNYTSWAAVLGKEPGSKCVSPIAAPARLKDLTGLAPAYIEVGALDIFRDECIEYARRLLQAGVDAELHVHVGATHGYDWFSRDPEFAARWKADRSRVIGSV